MAEWSLERLLKEAKTLVNPSGSKAKWRGRVRNYTSSAKRRHDRTIPFAGTNTLLVQFDHWGVTESRKVHRTQLQFIGLKVFREDDENAPAKNNRDYFIASYKGAKYLVEKPSIRTQVRVRCDCSDARHRFNFPNWEDGAIFGGKPRPYVRKTKDRPSVNKNDANGICKHLVGSVLAIESDGKIKPGTKSFKGFSA